MSTFQRRGRRSELAATTTLRSNTAPALILATDGAWTNTLAAITTPIVAALALVWLATIGLVVVTNFVSLNLVPLLYVLPVVVAATQWGIVPGLFAAVAGAAAADFFFYPPSYSFWLENRQDAIDLALYLVVAIVTSNLAARLKNEADTSTRREKEITQLHAFSQGLATCLTSRDLIFAVQDYLSNTLGYRAVLIASAPDDYAPDADAESIPETIRRAAERLIASGAGGAKVITDEFTHKAWLVRVIAPEILGYGAIAVELGRGSGEDRAGIAKQVEAMLEQATVALGHLKAKEAIEQATINYRTEILRDALIGGVSHELRTPLASILGSCSVLDRMPAILGDHDAHALLDGIADRAGELDNQIRDLLDASRITANGVSPQLAWTDPADIVDAAVKQKQRRLGAHRLVLNLQPDVPLLHVDTVLVEQALGQLLENAAKYSPSGSTITITSRRAGDDVVLSVVDQGSGLSADEMQQLGRRCYRSARHTASPGSGLGLWIASTFVAANGGCLHAESAGPNQGSTISLRLPLLSQDSAEIAEALND